MKKILLTTTFSLFFMLLAIGQINTEKTLVKSFNFKDYDEVLLEFGGDVTIEKRKSDILRVQIHIGVNNTSSMLKSLITAGRYNLKMTKNDKGQPVLHFPNLDKPMSIGGKKLQEKFSYIVQVPEDLNVIYGKNVNVDRVVVNTF